MDFSNYNTGKDNKRIYRCPTCGLLMDAIAFNWHICFSKQVRCRNCGRSIGTVYSDLRAVKGVSICPYCNFSLK